MILAVLAGDLRGRHVARLGRAGLRRPPPPEGAAARASRRRRPAGRSGRPGPLLRGVRAGGRGAGATAWARQRRILAVLASWAACGAVALRLSRAPSPTRPRPIARSRSAPTAGGDDDPRAAPGRPDPLPVLLRPPHRRAGRLPRLRAAAHRPAGPAALAAVGAGRRAARPPLRADRADAPRAGRRRDPRPAARPAGARRRPRGRPHPPSPAPSGPAARCRTCCSPWASGCWASPRSSSWPSPGAGSASAAARP